MVGLKALVVPPSLHTRVSPYPRQRMQRGALAAVFSGLAGGGVEGLTRMISSTSKQRGRERGRERRDGLDETGRRWGRQIVVKERRRKREGKERERWKPNVGRSHSFFLSLGPIMKQTSKQRNAVDMAPYTVTTDLRHLTCGSPAFHTFGMFISSTVPALTP
mmetsp:Transcript_10776/g.20851  ORF Transcript_10776/g.20851 Transcript_10776/m.20851 type:complete len:162 (+) Transcript_10776:720-1205(+)